MAAKSGFRKAMFPPYKDTLRKDTLRDTLGLRQCPAALKHTCSVSGSESALKQYFMGLHGCQVGFPVVKPEFKVQ